MTMDSPVLPSQTAPGGESQPASDPLARRELHERIPDGSVRSQRVAHLSFRVSLVVAGIRCLISYVIIPVLIPVLSVANLVAAPIGVLLYIIAGISGTISVRKFWITNHRGKWAYTVFIALVFVILAISLIADISKIVSGL